MKIYIKRKHLCRRNSYFAFALVCLSVYGLSGSCLVSLTNAQPFMNSLAVLFRARPPWPTKFPSGNGNSGTFQVFQNTIPQNPPGSIPAPLLNGASSQQGIIVAHPVHPNLQSNNFRKPPPNRPKFRPPRPQFPNRNRNSPPNQRVKSAQLKPLGSSSTVIGNFRYPDVPSPPQFQSMTGDDHPSPLPSASRFDMWQNSKEFQSNGDSGQKMLDFRPSPQLFEGSSISFPKSDEIMDGKYSSQFQANEAKRLPRYESGFQPISYNNQFGFHPGTTTPDPFHYTNHKITDNYYNPWSIPVQPTHGPDPITERTTAVPFHNKERQIVNPEVSKSIVTTDFSIEEVKSSEFPDHSFGSKLTSSSERVENWITPKAKPLTRNVVNSGSAEKFKFPIYKKKVRPIKCEKFHRYGFCPVTSNYPLEQVEKIASRCSALLSHLIVPLPKTNVHYDIVVTRNGSGRSASSRRPGSKDWSWKDFRGKPVCDTEELKIVPGWAKNENGDWLIILQTQLLKQEAQVSICSPPKSQCYGSSCEKGFTNLQNTKCVQRFSAQRLAVLDPEDQDRCPVVRAVFLPSACVCLSDDLPVDANIFRSVESTELQDTSQARGSSSEQVPILLPSMTSMNNGTYMIVSEKYSTKESSAESHEFS